jgi:hypothetical protein
VTSDTKAVIGIEWRTDLDMVEVETCLTTDTFAFEPGMQLAGSVAKSAERDARCGRVDGTKRRLFWIRQCVA